MCGRYTESREIKEIAVRFDVNQAEIEFKPSHNIGPGKHAPVITVIDGGRQLSLLRWGLVPSWAKDEKIAFKTFNARCETVFQKPSFRSAIKKRRCLIPADGYYEWVKTDGGKVPNYIYLKEHPLFAFAGIWESRDKAGNEKPLQTFSVVTTTPNEKLSELHHRMPVILSRDAEAVWLDHSSTPEQLQRLFNPFPGDDMLYHIVGPEVGNPRNDGPGLIEAAGRPAAEGKLL